MISTVLSMVSGNMPSNDIFIRTDKGYYVGGETIYGNVFLNINKNINSKGMILEIVGYEKVFWEYNETQSYQDENGQQRTRTIVKSRSADSHFFKDSFRLIDYPGGFPIGRFSYPFQYRLPPNLPGVFEKHRKHGLKVKAKIRYKIVAIVEIPGLFKHDLKVKQHLVIHERLDRSIEPKHHFKEKQVRTCCCVPRGPVKCECWMNKNAYSSGEVAQVSVKVENESAVEVRHFNSKLIREITLHAHGVTNVIRDIICMEKYPGTPPHSVKSTDIPLRLNGKRGKGIQPSTNSRLVKCQYFMMIELDVPWAPDLEIYSPVVIYAPLHPGWAQWQPPAWIQEAIPQQVNNVVAVPPEIIAAQMSKGYFFTQSDLPNVTLSVNPQMGVNLTQPPQIQLSFNVNEKSPLLS